MISYDVPMIIPKKKTAKKTKHKKPKKDRQKKTYLPTLWYSNMACLKKIPSLIDFFPSYSPALLGD
jgi:hypothetical protein